MEQGKEYFLKFIIETASDHEVYYYTRATIMNGDKIVPNQIKFAKKFSENTFNEENQVMLRRIWNQIQSMQVTV